MRSRIEGSPRHWARRRSRWRSRRGCGWWLCGRGRCGWLEEGRGVSEVVVEVEVGLK